MRKFVLFIVVVFLLFTLSGCVVFQKVMDVSGTWILEIEDEVFLAQIRSIIPQKDLTSRNDLTSFSILKLDQNGNTLTGTLFYFFYKITFTGTIGEDDQISLEAEITNSMTQERVPETVTIEITCKAQGNKTLFNKQATKLVDGELANSNTPGNPTEFEATKYN